MTPSLNHLESVLWLSMGPRETGDYVSCSLESVKSSTMPLEWRSRSVPRRGTKHASV